MLKTVYFDAHHRHKWQCFRIRLVDKMSNKDKVLRLIDFLQAVVLVFMTALFSIFAYAVMTVLDEKYRSTIVFCGMAFLLISIVILVVAIFISINKLEKMK